MVLWEVGILAVVVVVWVAIRFDMLEILEMFDIGAIVSWRLYLRKTEAAVQD